jgi:hypothetical protein
MKKIIKDVSEAEINNIFFLNKNNLKYKPDYFYKKK